MTPDAKPTDRDMTGADPHHPARNAARKAEINDRPGGSEGVMSEEDELDEAIEETFPASDPISPMQR